MAATAAPKREIRFGPPVGGPLPLPPLLEGVAKNVALASISACSRIWSAPVPPRLCRQAQPGPSRAFSLNDKALAMRVLSLSGEASAARSEPAVSTLIRKVSGLRRYCPRRFVRKAAMTSSGPVAGTRALYVPRVSAIVMARFGSLLSGVAAHGAVDAGPQGSREGRWSRGLPEAIGSRRRLTPQRGHVSSADVPKGGEVRKTRTSRAPLILRPRAATRCGHTPRASCGLRVSAARPSPSRS